MNAVEKEIKDLRKKQEAELASQKNELWRSVAEKQDSESSILQRRGQEFVELPKEASENDGSQLSVSRRGFFKWMTAASTLMTSAACSRRPKDYLVPYVHKPQGYTYGAPVYFASTLPSGVGVVVKTREGRPIKLEGNEDHPYSRGGLDVASQASILNLYNPERLKQPLDFSTKKNLSWEDADQRVVAALSKATNGSVRVLTGNVVSPSLSAKLSSFEKNFSAKTLSTEAIPYNAMARAHELVMGSKRIPYIDFEKADVVLSVDADFLGSWLRPIEFTKSFSRRRNIHRDSEVELNRLFTFESMYSITGVSSDHRFPIKPSKQLDVLLAVIDSLSSRLNFDSSIKSLASKFSAEKVANDLGIAQESFAELAEALYQARGRSVIVGSCVGPKSLEVQLACVALNAALGNYGKTLSLDTAIVNTEDSAIQLDELAKDCRDGAVEVLILQGVNPLYSRPNSELSRALAKVPFIIQLTHELNETSEIAHLCLPESHYLEAWGDAMAIEGAVAVQQPVIDPLYGSRSFAEALDVWTSGATTKASEALKAFWSRSFFGNSLNTNKWMDVLKKGVLTRSLTGTSNSFRWSGAAASIQSSLDEKTSGLELASFETVQLRDGTYANNAWLQELPDPVTKVTWDNYAALSPAKAKELGLNQNDVVQIRSGESSISLPVLVQPGLHSDVVAVALGYGRSKAGSVGSDVGANAYEFFRTSSSGEVQLSGASVELVKTGRTHKLATTQHYFDIHGRDDDILNQATWKDFKKNPRVARGAWAPKEPSSLTMYEEHSYPGHKWGMNVDMTKCTGCNACVVACYSENNIAVAGRDQVDYGRHMAWLRLDLYYKGDEANPEASFQPMMCQHCDKAPCETVCPVLATVHSSDGLNDMVYNRCVGTRYCANNCPYKVRRFNYFQYSDSLGGKMDINYDSPLSMMLNPDVTVRTRGVMEKCTFCVQRIRKGVDEEKAKQGSSYKYRIPDGTVKTACQQSCPAEAIVFGDLNDPNSEVTELADKAQAYKVLAVLNTSPAVSYMPKIRNKGTDA